MTDEFAVFDVKSIYGFHTRQALVVLTAPDGTETQMSPEDATALALNLLQGAEAARGDAFLINFLQQQIGLTLEQVGSMLAAFRQFRDGGPTP